MTGGPTTVEALQLRLRDARTRGERLWPIGGGRHCRRPLPPDVTPLRLSGFNTVEHWDDTSLVVTAGAGISIAALAETISAHGASLSGWRREHPEATLGGLLSRRQPVVHALWNGSVREACLGLTGVTADGHRYHYLPAPRKASGPDLRHIFIGAEGTFGIVTSVSLRVSPKPEALELIEFETLSPVEALGLLRRAFAAGLRASNIYYSGGGARLRCLLEGSAVEVEVWREALRSAAVGVATLKSASPGSYYDPAAGDLRAGADPAVGAYKGRQEDPEGGVAIWGNLVALEALPAEVWQHGVLYDLSLHQASLWLPRAAVSKLSSSCEEHFSRARLRSARQIWLGAAPDSSALAFERHALKALKAKFDPGDVLPSLLEEVS